MEQPIDLNRAFAATGTRFRLFPDGGRAEAETVYLSVPPARIGPGPSDDRVFVADAVAKEPYSNQFGPPYTGACHPPVAAGPGGHFDHLQRNTRQFSCATMYATVRRVLDVWEAYLGYPIEWHGHDRFPRLELVPLLRWPNAHYGLGFLEAGYRLRNDALDLERPYCRNFEALAHELGHGIVWAVTGLPVDPHAYRVDFNGFQESTSDLIAIVASLHFDTLVDRLLASTKGNLLSPNALSDFGEWAGTTAVRRAFNNYTLSTLLKDEAHIHSLPLTGAVFDVLVETFQHSLVEQNLISPGLALQSTNEGTAALPAVQAAFDEAYRGRAVGFKTALLRARDQVGRLLACTWADVTPDALTYGDVLASILRADRRLTGGAYQDLIRGCFTWREIEVPQSSAPTHTFCATTCIPEA